MNKQIFLCPAGDLANFDASYGAKFTHFYLLKLVLLNTCSGKFYNEYMVLKRTRTGIIPSQVVKTRREFLDYESN